jgi:anti-sigma regulatory factor (Ser/Thr protein kinase)
MGWLSAARRTSGGSLVESYRLDLPAGAAPGHFRRQPADTGGRPARNLAVRRALQGQRCPCPARLPPAPFRRGFGSGAAGYAAPASWWTTRSSAPPLRYSMRSAIGTTAPTASAASRSPAARARPSRPGAARDHRPGTGAVDPHRLLVLLTELVTNAVRHGGANAERSVCVRVVRSPRSIRVGVTDPRRGFAWRGRPVRRPAPDGGFGLLLVDRLASRWGIQPEEHSTTVWFELRRGDYSASARRSTRGVAELE